MGSWYDSQKFKESHCNISKSILEFSKTSKWFKCALNTNLSLDFLKMMISFMLMLRHAMFMINLILIHFWLLPKALHHTHNRHICTIMLMVGDVVSYAKSNFLNCRKVNDAIICCTIFESNLNRCRIFRTSSLEPMNHNFKCFNFITPISRQNHFQCNRCWKIRFHRSICTSFISAIEPLSVLLKHKLTVCLHLNPDELKFSTTKSVINSIS